MIGKAVLFGLLSVVFYAYLTSEPLPPDLAVEYDYTRLKAIVKVKSMVMSVAPFFGVNLVKFRRNIDSLAMPTLTFSDNDIEVVDELFDSVPVRLFIPRKPGKALKSGMVHMHGGGWIYGSIDTSHPFVRQLALDTGAVIASVGYRLAPEHIFPAAYDDAIKATVHFTKNAKQYGVDTSRIAVIGESAGGNLAAAVSLGIRDNYPEIKLKLQILNNPVTQCADFNLPSYQQNDKLTSFLLSKPAMVGCCLMYAIGPYTTDIKVIVTNNRLSQSILANKKYKNYLNHNWIPRYLIPAWYEIISISEDKVDSDLERKFTDQVRNPYLSPLLSPNLKSLPQAYVMVSEYDVLRDDALLYIRRLRDANVTVTEAYDKTVHVGGFFGSPAQKLLRIGGEAIVAYYKMIGFIMTNL